LARQLRTVQNCGERRREILKEKVCFSFAKQVRQSQKYDADKERQQRNPLRESCGAIPVPGGKGRSPFFSILSPLTGAAKVSLAPLKSYRKKGKPSAAGQKGKRQTKKKETRKNRFLPEPGALLPSQIHRFGPASKKKKKGRSLQHITREEAPHCESPAVEGRKAASSPPRGGKGKKRQEKEKRNIMIPPFYRSRHHSPHPKIGQHRGGGGRCQRKKKKEKRDHHPLLGKRVEKDHIVPRRRKEVLSKKGKPLTAPYSASRRGEKKRRGRNRPHDFCADTQQRATQRGKKKRNERSCPFWEGKKEGRKKEEEDCLLLRKKKG